MKTDKFSGPGKRRRRFELKLLLLMIILELEGPVGRYRLKEMLDLSEQEGVVRLMLDDLKAKGLIKTRKTGCELTKAGSDYLTNTFKEHNIVKIEETGLESMSIDSEGFIFHCRGSPMPTSLTALRDVAVRNGADGAILFLYNQGTLTVPGVYSNLEQENPDITFEITGKLSLLDGDIIIVSFSKNKWRALEGGLFMAVYLKQSIV